MLKWIMVQLIEGNNIKLQVNQSAGYQELKWIKTAIKCKPIYIHLTRINIDFFVTYTYIFNNEWFKNNILLFVK